jgi:hypothetical protein
MKDAYHSNSTLIQIPNINRDTGLVASNAGSVDEEDAVGKIGSFLSPYNSN